MAVRGGAAGWRSGVGLEGVFQLEGEHTGLALNPLQGAHGSFPIRSTFNRVPRGILGGVAL